MGLVFWQCSKSEWSVFLLDRMGSKVRIDDETPVRRRYRLQGSYFLQAEEGVASANLEDSTLGVPQVKSYAVNRKTADIWDAVVCQEISPLSLARFQVVFRKHIGLTDTEYLKFETPVCSANG